MRYIFPIIKLALGISHTDQGLDPSYELIEIIAGKLAGADFNSIVVNHIQDRVATHPWLSEEMRERCGAVRHEALPRDIVRAPLTELFRNLLAASFSPTAILVILAEIEQLVVRWADANRELLEPYTPWSDETAASASVSASTTIPSFSLDHYRRDYPRFAAYLQSRSTRIDERLERSLAMLERLPKLPPFRLRFDEIERDLAELTETMEIFESSRDNYRGFLSEFYVATALRLLDIDKNDGDKRRIGQELTASSEQISNSVHAFELALKAFERAYDQFKREHFRFQQRTEEILVDGLSYVTSSTAFDIAYEHHLGTWKALKSAYDQEKQFIEALQTMIDDVTRRAEELLL